MGKLSSWRHRQLSLVGRVCLINSVFTSLPLFYRLSLFLGIFCGRKGGIIGNWVNWRNVCCLRSHGGLGVEDLKLFNVALLAKWRWNLFHQQDTLLGDILNAKYGG